MELVELARGHLKVKEGDRYVTIYGEAFLRGHGSPDFLLYSNSLEKWDAPFEEHEILNEKKTEILNFVKEEFQRRKMILEIE